MLAVTVLYNDFTVMCKDFHDLMLNPIRSLIAFYCPHLITFNHTNTHL